MRRLLLILLIFPLWKCGGANEDDETIIELVIVMEYYENGNLRHEGGEIEGQWEGEHKWYYETGELEMSANYKRSLENGEQYFFYKNGQIKSVNTKLNGTLKDTVFYFLENGELEAYQIFSTLGELKKKSFYDPGEKLKSESFFVKVHYNDSPLLNTFIVYGEERKILNDESVYYSVSEEAVTVFEENDSNAFCELTYNGEFHEKYILVYGNFDEEFFADNSNIDTIIFDGDKVKLPLNTEKNGDNIARFRIEDWKWGIHPQNPEKGKGYMKRFVHGTFDYFVE